MIHSRSKHRDVRKLDTLQMQELDELIASNKYLYNSTEKPSIENAPSMESHFSKSKEKETIESKDLPDKIKLEIRDETPSEKDGTTFDRQDFIVPSTSLSVDNEQESLLNLGFSGESRGDSTTYDNSTILKSRSDDTDEDTERDSDKWIRESDQSINSAHVSPSQSNNGSFDQSTIDQSTMSRHESCSLEASIDHIDETRDTTTPEILTKHKNNRENSQEEVDGQTFIYRHNENEDEIESHSGEGDLDSSSPDFDDEDSESEDSDDAVIIDATSTDEMTKANSEDLTDSDSEYSEVDEMYSSMEELRVSTENGEEKTESFVPPDIRPEIHAISSIPMITEPVMRDVSPKELENQQEARDCVVNRDYGNLFRLIKENPRLVGIQSNQTGGQTLLHLMASQQMAPPENVLLKTISQDPSLVGLVDNRGNTPLHCAAKTARTETIEAFEIFLRFHPIGATERNQDGNLPLHLAASNSNPGADNAVHLLLEAYAKGITLSNNLGQLPLHLMLTEGSGNTSSIRTLLHMHKLRKSDVTLLDNRGVSPLHAAIMHHSPFEAIKTFNRIVRGSFLDAYVKKDQRGYIPLHVALKTRGIDPRILLSLIEAAPYTGCLRFPDGTMPICIATKRKMRSDIIQTLLASDMPIELGNKRGSKAGMGGIVEREHGNSWWHIAVECRDTYIDCIRKLLSDKATFVQAIALARSVGPDKKTLTIEAGTASLEAVFKNLLKFYYRYEILTEKLPFADSEVQSFNAIDHGGELEEMKSKEPWLYDGFTKVVRTGSRMATSENELEVSFTPWDNNDKEVTLRCYAFEDPFEAEISVRKHHNLSTNFVEEIINVHNVENYVNASFTTGKLLCIAFERNNKTLKEMMKEKRNPGDKNWLVKCHRVLKYISEGLDHLNSAGLVHGHFDPTTVALFNNKWKLTEIGSAITMGSAVNGSLRRCIPPESVVLFDKMNLKKMKSKGIILSEKDELTPNSTISNVDTLNVVGAEICCSPRNNPRFTFRKSGTKYKSNFEDAVPLPPRSDDATKKPRKRFGIFLFGMQEMGLGNYGWNSSKTIRSRSIAQQGSSIRSSMSKNNNPMGSTIQTQSLSQISHSFVSADENATNDSLRIIAMQEDEISRLRQALEVKERIYRSQLVEERAAFKRHEIERERESQRTNSIAVAKLSSKIRFAPEKVMASPTWDIWSLGLVMVEMMLGRTALLPCFMESDEEFLEKLIKFDEIQLESLQEKIHDVAGNLAADLIARLLHPNPRERIGSFSKVLQHKYFHEHVQGAPMSKPLLSTSLRNESDESALSSKVVAERKMEKEKRRKKSKFSFSRKN